jgi:crotonobetainyl-CoA:carnitine CoA-transferase CaiB-like acyl-CoA transferase
MPGLGLGFETLRQVNPGLVMTSISSFGQTGPYRDYQASDLTIWGLSGILYELGEPDREPLKMGSQVSEYVAGLYGCLVSLAALFYRHQSGVGQHVDLSSWEAFHTMQPSMTIVYSYAGFIRKRGGIHFPWGILPCEDGYIGFYFPTQTHWELLCTLLEMPELVDKPEYETPMLREERRDEITAIIVSWLKGKRMEDVFHAAQELRLPLTIVPNVRQVLELEQHKTRGFFAESDHPVAGRLTYPGASFKLAETPWQAGRAPLLGEHNDEIYYARLSYGKDRIEELAGEGVI